MKRQEGWNYFHDLIGAGDKIPCASIEFSEEELIHFKEALDLMKEMAEVLEGYAEADYYDSGMSGEPAAFILKKFKEWK